MNAPSNMDKYFFNIHRFPWWCHKEYKDTLTTFSNISKSISKLTRAIALLEDHATKGTVPKSLNVNIKAQVEKSYQAQVDREVKDAAAIFQKTVLTSIISARKKELEDKNKARDDVVKKFLNDFLTKLTDMRSQNIIRTPDSDLKESYKNCEVSFLETCQEIEDDARIEEYLAFQRKQEAMQKAQATREEARLNQVLEDPTTKALQERLDALEKRVQQVAKPPPKPGKNKVQYNPQTPKTRGPKGKGLPKKPAGGPKNDAGKGNPKRPPPSIPSTRPSASKKTAFRKKQN